ncbi:hypothetical protein [Paraburkholderia sp.]|jgi:hypothetical protein|uniref:hypothetical protein n=1 Tax=Paraburkholderia sp. TaxID=1926495 RepID=UPI002F40CC7A
MKTLQRITLWFAVELVLILLYVIAWSYSDNLFPESSTLAALAYQFTTVNPLDDGSAEMLDATYKLLVAFLTVVPISIVVWLSGKCWHRWFARGGRR